MKKNIQLYKFATFSLLFSFLFSCQQESGMENQQEEPQIENISESREDLNSKSAIIKGDGVGLIKIGGPVDQIKKEADLHGFRVAHDTVLNEGMKEARVSLYNEDDLVLQIEPDNSENVYRIFVKSDFYKTEKGISVGNRVQQLKEVYGEFTAIGGEPGIMLRVPEFKTLAFVIRHDAAIVNSAPDVKIKIDSIEPSAVIEEIYIY